MHILLETFLVFAKIGAFSFGGGYAMLPLIEKEVVYLNNYMTKSQFMDILVISQMTPGPIATNSATFVGYMNYGFFGALFATLGVVSGPFLYISIFVNKFLDRFKDSPIMIKILASLRPVTVALIFCTFITTLMDTKIDIFSISVFMLSLVLMMSKRLSPMATIVIFGLIGVVKVYII